MLCTRAFQPGEKQKLYALLDHPDPQIRRRAKAVLLSAEGHSANQLVPRVNLTAKSIRKWLTRFNSQGVQILTKQPKSPGRKPIFTPAQRPQMVQLALTKPQSLGQPFTTWSLDKLVTHLREHEKICISKSWLSQILQENGLSPLRFSPLDPVVQMAGKAAWSGEGTSGLFAGTSALAEPGGAILPRLAAGPVEQQRVWRGA